jgi:catechol 2,3-dioxygenase-like lactoylglutathione lyase family enzyme
MMRFHHTAISTGNLERAVTFYHDLFGFEVAAEFAWPAGSEVTDRIMNLAGSAGRATMLRRGNAMIEIFEFSSPRPQPGNPHRPVCDHGLTHICFDVQDIQAEYSRLTSAGMTFHCPPQRIRRTEWATYGRDPDGNVIELIQIGNPNHPMALR